jgi:hypothetical protein
LIIAGLARAKKRGTLLGNRTNLAEAAAKGTAAIRQQADTFAANLLPLIRQLQASGIRTVRALADELNARSVRTAHGGMWHKTTVHKLLTRGVAAVQAHRRVGRRRRRDRAKQER